MFFLTWRPLEGRLPTMTYRVCRYGYGCRQRSVMVEDGNYQAFIKPRKQISNFITMHTGIDNEMVATAPSFGCRGVLRVYSTILERLFLPCNIPIRMASWMRAKTNGWQSTKRIWRIFFGFVCDGYSKPSKDKPILEARIAKRIRV